jgi:UDP-N-acetylmuramoyl-tripeptide--D-alanyl-D-alanine ligase
MTALLGPSRLHDGVAWITVAACVAACVPAGLRWIRVAQREHYLAGSVARFAARWWRVTPLNGCLAVLIVAAGVVSIRWPLAGAAAAAGVAVGPVGLSLKGRTSALAWTRRLRTLALVWAVLEIVVVVVGVVLGPAAPVAVLAAVAVPLLVDLACLVTRPFEQRLGAHFVDEAAARLARVAPTVVAVTGSYGKTSTKGHIAHLVRPSRTVVATPASFNNRAGLARAVNEHLADGTEVFVAEMGTYGPGEIADLCRWCPPDVAVITAIGPVHLERFGTEERIVEAKSEILVNARDVVLAVDDPRLGAVADRAEAEGKRVRRCSALDVLADVSVVRHDERHPEVSVVADGDVLAEHLTLPTGVQPTNLACAIAVALLVGVEPEAIGRRLADLPAVDHRLQAVPSGSGATILDDTYNSNPAGASEALVALAGRRDLRDRNDLGDLGGGQGPGASTTAADPGRLVVVTPGMVELGSRQFEENRKFGAAAAEVADHLLVVGRTNRRALVSGAGSVTGSSVQVMLLDHREQAVEWVRNHLGPGDAVLYENDLPDHYP